MAELTWQERQRFTNQEVEDEMRRLNIPTGYPAVSEFSEDEINKAIDLLESNYLYDDAATLIQGEWSPAVIAAWAALAKAIGSNISMDGYGRMAIRVATSDEKRRESALSNLRTGLNQKRRDTAIRSLLQQNP